MAISRSFSPKKALKLIILSLNVLYQRVRYPTGA